ncbi:MAG: flagellar basal-body rod protein FlgF [Spirochaetales bacterium]|jgi:flagellar basal-body rod protein FlgF|nr:flagellar basal-body rod protein FlgF [Spirochaetales bacterium]
MLRGIYTGASGMVAQMHRMDALSNNLANVDVTGYKRDTSISKAFPEMLIHRVNDNGTYKFPFGSVETGPIAGTLGTGVEFNELYTVFTQGALKETNNPFDLALDGEGFFAIDTQHGERFTRNGTFVLGKEGMLLTKEGMPVLGENGPIKIKKNNFVIDAQGRVFQNGALSGDPQRMVSIEENEWESMELVDTLRIVEFSRDRYLKKQGNSLWMSTDESGDARNLLDSQRPKVYQGFLEASNVNPVREMVNLIEVNRAYEANQKTIQTQDDITGKLINEAIRV